jgi:hypothetical protein
VLLEVPRKFNEQFENEVHGQLLEKRAMRFGREGREGAGQGSGVHQTFRGPRSAWFQSEGIPVLGSTGEPPPHLRPARTRASPRVA